jgi:hypothetical protein
MTRILDLTRIWLVDTRPDVTEEISRSLTRRTSCLSERFHDCEALVRSFAQLVADGTLAAPFAMVTDRVGTAPLSTHSSAAEQLHSLAPLSVVILYSALVDSPAEADRERIDDLLARHLVDVAVSKAAPVEELLDLVSSCRERWDLPVACKLREFIGRDETPESGFFEDGYGGYYNLYEVHRQIVLGTKIGRVLDRVWEGILNDPRRTTSSPR